MNHLRPDVVGTVFDDPTPELTRVYADALLGASEKTGQAEAVLDEVEELIADVWDAHPDFESMMRSPSLAGSEKSRILNEVLGGKASDTTLHFLQVLNRRGRLDLLRPVARRARASWERKNGRLPVVVRTAVALEADQVEALKARLSKLLNAMPILHLEVEPSLIGGLVVQVGDTIFDASVRSIQLEKLRSLLIEERTHLVLSQRDILTTL